jgi:hypothetical protein
MRYPPSEQIGLRTAPDGSDYNLRFYGENEGAAVITGPIRRNVGRMVEVPEIHREHASDAADARRKLESWCNAQGWL